MGDRNREELYRRWKWMKMYDRMDEDDDRVKNRETFRSHDKFEMQDTIIERHRKYVNEEREREKKRINDEIERKKLKKEVIDLKKRVSQLEQDISDLKNRSGSESGSGRYTI